MFLQITQLKYSVKGLADIANAVCQTRDHKESSIFDESARLEMASSG
jgi:hypothetical protein